MKLYVILAAAMLFVCGCASCALAQNIEKPIEETAEYILNTVTSPSFGQVGGEWAVFGLSRSGYDIPEKYFEEYYERVEFYTASVNGILSTRKNTEYSRLIIALTAIGKNPQNVCGYNLLLPLADFNGTVRQGINGAIWALLALDCGNYDIPINKNSEITAARDMYIERILEYRTSDGGWSVYGKADNAEPDITAMAIQALSKYRDREEVKKAVDKAVLRMSEMQTENGGFVCNGAENSESTAQAIIALCELGIPIDDEKFVKNGKTLIDNLLSFRKGGGFLHTYADTEADEMATEQAFYSLVAAKRAAEGKTSLYRIKRLLTRSDVVKTFENRIKLWDTDILEAG